MLPYTTPRHQFKLPVPANMISELYITYAQDDLIIFEKTLADCIFVDNHTRVVVSLKQEDTANVNDCGHKVEVQMTIKTLDGRRFTSRAKKINIKKVLKKEVI